VHDLDGKSCTVLRGETDLHQLDGLPRGSAEGSGANRLAGRGPGRACCARCSAPKTLDVAMAVVPFREVQVASRVVTGVPGLRGVAELLAISRA